MRVRSEPGNLIWHFADDGETLVYHLPSGDTHLLNDFSAAVLSELSERSWTLPELATEIYASEALPASTALSRVEELLETFDALGLIERLP